MALLLVVAATGLPFALFAGCVVCCSCCSGQPDCKCGRCGSEGSKQAPSGGKDGRKVVPRPPRICLALAAVVCFWEFCCVVWCAWVIIVVIVCTSTTSAVTGLAVVGVGRVFCTLCALVSGVTVIGNCSALLIAPVLEGEGSCCGNGSGGGGCDVGCELL